MKYLILAVCCFLLACGGSDDAQGEVTIYFNHTVAGADLKHEDILYTNAAGNEYGVTRLEYIVSDIALESVGGKRVELAEFHYRNAFVSATRSVAAKVPGGEYAVLRFTFGIDGAKNETGALPSVDHFNNMAWPAPMGGGYHYMRMEGLFRTADGEGAFLTHTGPADGEDFSFAVSLPLSLTVSGDEWAIAVVMDLNEWYDAPSLYDFDDRGGIMGNADAQLTLQGNGTTVFSLGPIGNPDHVGQVHGEEEAEQDRAAPDHDEHVGG